MLRTLKDLFDRALAPVAGAPPADEAHRLQLATAVLLVEVMRAEDGIADAERAAAVRALQHKFALADDEVQRLLELAQRRAHEAVDFHAFTSALNAALDMPAKLRVVEAMWAVAYADGTLAAHERHVLWRVADLLHVPQGAYHHARLRAKAAAGL
jgi:uncharacterized tellurite resistance protein B-like protein